MANLCKCGESLLWGDSCGYCDYQELLALRERVEEQDKAIAGLNLLIHDAIVSGNVCLLHDGGTSEGCAGCFDFEEVRLAAEALKTKSNGALSRIREMLKGLVK